MIWRCWKDVCHPARVNWELFGLGAVHYACAGELDLVEDPRLQATLQAFAAREYGESRLPNPALIVATDLARNNLASFLVAIRSPYSLTSSVPIPESQWIVCGRRPDEVLC